MIPRGSRSTNSTSVKEKKKKLEYLGALNKQHAEGGGAAGDSGGKERLQVKKLYETNRISKYRCNN